MSIQRRAPTTASEQVPGLLRGRSRQSALRTFVHCPLPPAKTGIADYNFELLPFLANDLAVTVVDDESSVAEDVERALDRIGVKVITADEYERQADDGSIDIYQIGNNPFHLRTLFRALRRPGVVVIHDASISGLLTACDHSVANRFLEYELGLAARHFREARDQYALFSWQQFLVRNLGLLVDSAKAVIVHSNFAKNLIARRYRQPNIFLTEHHVARQFLAPIEGAVENPSVGEFIKNNKQRVVIGTFGFLTPPKRVDWLIAAFKNALAAGHPVALLLAGEPHPDTGIPELIREIPEERVCVTGFLSEQDMIRLMSSIDLQVNLRFPSVGESSGTLVRAMGLGVPVVVLDHESFSSISDGLVSKLTLDQNVPEQLTRLFLSFMADPEPFKRKAQKARTWVRDACSLEGSAETYRLAAQQSLSLRGRRLLPEIADRLVEAIGVTIAFRQGTRPLGERICDQLVRNVALSTLAEDEDFDVILVPDLAEYEIDTEADRTNRRVFISVVNADINVDEFSRRIDRLDLQKFDMLVLIFVPSRLFETFPSARRLLDSQEVIARHLGLALRNSRKAVVSSIGSRAKIVNVADVSAFEYLG